MTDISKELLTRADVIFGKITDAVVAGKDLAMEQLPDIATQFILYNRVYYSACIVAICFLIVLALLLHKKGIQTYKNWKEESDGAGFHMMTLPIYFVLMFLIPYTFNPFIMVWFAPKIFIITELIKLVK